jgi:predicted ester cyclase
LAVAGSHVDTVRAYYEAGERNDWETAGSYVGPGYVWIDHATGVEARTPSELYEAQLDADAWSDTRFEITDAYEVPDGTVIVQAIQTSTVAGLWRGMETTGQRFSVPFCTVFRSDADARIVHEEMYYDMESVKRQLGY